MVSSQEKVAILGAGVVGTAIGHLLAKKGIPVVAVSSRSFRSAQRAARFIGKGARAYRDPLEAASQASVVFLTTPDRSIAELCNAIAKKDGFRRKTLVIHTSGFFSSRILNSARRNGAHVGSIHPLQSFATPEAAVRLLPGSVFGWEGSGGGQGRMLRLIRALGGIPMEISPSTKALYHASAVLVSNYSATLFSQGVQLLERARVGSKTNFSSDRALLPLLLGTVSNLANLGLPKALTGPISRGEVAVVRGHLRMMRRRAKGFVPLYALLGRRTIPLGLAKGALRPAQAAALRKLLR